MPSRRAAFSLLVVAGLAITLGAKALAPNSDLQLDETAYSPTLVTLLRGQGFAATIEPRASNSDVVAARGACRLRARMQGALFGLAAFRYITQDLPAPAFRYRGAWSQDFPRGRYEILSRLQWLGVRYGMVQGVEIPLLVAASRECNLSEIDFGSQRVPARGS